MPGDTEPLLLLCDEPTANVDQASDHAVHSALLRLRCTVVVIAHRLQQTQRFDKVVVLDTGRVVEEGEPAALMRDPDGHFARLCARAGVAPLPQQDAAAFA